MCGLTGFWTRTSFTEEELQHYAFHMAEKIRYRGPDSYGVWFDVKKGIVMAHRRLAILDLTEAGSQPMASPSKRYKIIFNGEIYNIFHIQQELINYGYSFKSRSDTEIMLSAIEHYGLREAVNRFIGMFAFALWDEEQHKLFLVRDRLGVKPLYYGVVGSTFFFGSQVKSFYPHPHWRGIIDPQSLTEFLTYNYIPGTLSIYQNIQKARPGAITIVREDFSCREEIYWSVFSIYKENHIAHKPKNSLVFSERKSKNYKEKLHHLLRDAVQLRMVSDVPIGAFLSGGIDSSLIVAMMQEISPTPVKTFTIGFQEDKFNEATYAEAIARYLKTDHYTFYLTSSDAINIIPHLNTCFDEPFADISQIPTYLISQKARKHITVALSGDGGDEIFAGYKHYAICQKLWHILSFIPPAVKNILPEVLNFLIAHCNENFLKTFLPFSHPKDKIQKVSDLIFFAKTSKDLFHGIYRMWSDDALQRMTGSTPQYFHKIWQLCLEGSSFLDQMQLCDAIMYLADNILVKVDRASMAHSLEVRGPLLDHRIISLAWSLPEDLKIYQGQGKRILRSILSYYMPSKLFERPKQGFGVPIAEWLRGPLKDWANNLISKQALEESGFIDTQPILQRWEEHISNKGEWHNALWGILMYQAWRTSL